MGVGSCSLYYSVHFCVCSKCSLIKYLKYISERGQLIRRTWERVEIMGQVLPQILEWNLSYRVERKPESLSFCSLFQASSGRAFTMSSNLWWPWTQSKKIFLFWRDPLCSGPKPAGRRCLLPVLGNLHQVLFFACVVTQGIDIKLGLFHLLSLGTFVSLTRLGKTLAVALKLSFPSFSCEPSWLLSSWLIFILSC